jgi:oxygen-independent coproporphyrinogen-3 oxidase
MPAGRSAAASGESGAEVPSESGVAAPREFTAEANPGTLSPGKLALLREAGCNRLSLGAQSFDDRCLAWLGRRHRARDFRQAWAAARQAGFRNMNLDLIYGLPGQTLAHWRRTLEQALALQPEHIALYQLNIEPETVLARRAAAGEVCQAGEEACRRQYLLAHELLTAAGFNHYEISNFALTGKESRHNTLYWRNGYYVGLGAGAAGYLPAGGEDQGAGAGDGAGTDTGAIADAGVRPGTEPAAPPPSQGIRYTNMADLASYLAAVEQERLPLAERETITPALGRREELMLAFRLRQGIEAAAFRRRWGLDLWQEYGSLLDKHLTAGWLQAEGGRLCPTVEGWLAYNY